MVNFACTYFLGNLRHIINHFLCGVHRYMVLGNHDYLPDQSSTKVTNPQAQIDFGKQSSRWYLPDYRYAATFALPAGKSLFVVRLLGQLTIL